MKNMGLPGKILCILMLLLHSSQEEGFNDQETLHLPANYKIGWMDSLDNNQLISDITIPGTHDSLARYGGPAAKCQAWSLESQLKAGIRYFDLRVSGENLKIKHGATYQDITFPAALSIIRKFLSDHKTETVLVRVKPVFFFKDRVPHLVGQIIEEATDVWVSEEIPPIGDVRGKIVFVQKDCFNLGIPLYETDERNDYIVNDVEVKKRRIVTHLTMASNEENRSDKVVLNYSSGTGWPKFRLHKTPKWVAERINAWLYNYLNTVTNPKTCFGVIAMDFPDINLINKITKFNTFVKSAAAAG